MRRDYSVCLMKGCSNSVDDGEIVEYCLDCQKGIMTTYVRERNERRRTELVKVRGRDGCRYDMHRYVSQPPGKAVSR